MGTTVRAVAVILFPEYPPIVDASFALCSSFLLRCAICSSCSVDRVDESTLLFATHFLFLCSFALYFVVPCVCVSYACSIITARAHSAFCDIPLQFEILNLNF